MPEVFLGGVSVGETTLPYLIAEVGVNHEGDLDRARAMIRSAQAAGAQAVKFQVYKAEHLAARHSPAYWDTRAEPATNQRSLFGKYDRFGPIEYRLLAECAASEGITFLATPFDAEAVEYLDPLVPFFKIASADITNFPLLRQVARRRKPIVLSTGAATLGEIEEALQVVQQAGGGPTVLLHCILCYPTAIEDANLAMISHLRVAFPQCVIGYSDHTVPDPSMCALTAAQLLGARVIEKHFTDDKTQAGNDHYHAMDESDVRRAVRNFQLVRTLLGEPTKRPVECELPARLHARRSMVAARAIRQGEPISESATVFKRPGHGIPPALADAVYGRHARRDIGEDEVITWDMV